MYYVILGSPLPSFTLNKAYVSIKTSEFFQNAVVGVKPQRSSASKNTYYLPEVNYLNSWDFKTE